MLTGQIHHAHVLGTLFANCIGNLIWLAIFKLYRLSEIDSHVKLQSTSLVTRQMASSLQFISTLGSAVLIVFILNAGRDVLIPFALSILFAFLLTPSVNWLQWKGLSNPAAVAVVTLSVALLFTLSAMLLWSSISDFASNMPKYREEITRKVSSVDSYVRDVGSNFNTVIQEFSRQVSSPENKERTSKSNSKGRSQKVNDSELASTRQSASEGNQKDSVERLKEPSTTASNEQEDLTSTDLSNAPALGGSPEKPVYTRQLAPGMEISWKDWAGGAGAVFGPLGTVGLVTVFALFLLVNRDDLRDRFVSVVSRGNYAVTTDAIADATTRISRYLVAQLILNVSYGLFFGVGLFFIGWLHSSENGFPSLLFLSTVAGLFRFIPYFGAWIAATLPLAISIAVFPGYSAFVFVLVWIVLLELTSNNIIEPWFYGSSTGVSSIAIITAAVFWGWLWGVVGLLLATPLTVCLVVLGRYIPKLSFFVTLLSDEQQIKPDQRIYQRLLSGETHKLVDALVEEASGRDAIEFVDQVVVPTTKRIMRNRHKDDSHDYEFAQTLLETLKEHRLPSVPSSTLVSNVVVPTESTEAVETNHRSLPICYGIVARHPCENVVLNSLQAILQPLIDFRIGDSNNLPDREIDNIVAANPDAVVIVSLPPGGLSETRFWCKSLRSQGFQGEIIIARPGKFRNFDRILTSFRRLGASALTTSIAQTTRRLMLLKDTHPDTKAKMQAPEIIVQRSTIGAL